MDPSWAQSGPRLGPRKGPSWAQGFLGPKLGSSWAPAEFKLGPSCTQARPKAVDPRCAQARPKALDPSWAQVSWAQAGSRLGPSWAQSGSKLVPGGPKAVGPSWVPAGLGPTWAQSGAKQGPGQISGKFGNLQFGHLEVRDPQKVKIHSKLYQSAILPIDSINISRRFSVCVIHHQEIIFFL